MCVVGLFAGLALIVAAVGVYATTAFNVSSRHDEIGVRQAIGAQPGDLLRMFLRQGLARAIPGVAAGLLISLALGRLVESLLFEVAPLDPWVHATVAITLSLLALAAAALPAARAARVSPMQVMRSE
jgi:ABC-type antimicrobial peptide transport system permease subunit